MPAAIGTFTEKSIPQGDLNIVTGNAGNGTVILEEAGLPLAVTYKAGKGLITVLTYDPTLSTISGWENSKTLWEKLIIKADLQNKEDQELQQSGTFARPFGSYEHLASNVPETQTPPFTALLIMIGIYIVIAGPLVYLFLKWKDKRDLNWLAIPAVAFVFLAVIYIAGFKTRYTTGVLNGISIISVEQGSGSAEIDTVMGAFNNKRRDMKLEYDRDSGFEVNPSSNYYEYYSYSSSSNGSGPNASVISKLTFGDPCVYELYDAGMWEPRYIYAKSSKKVSGDIVSSVSINEGTFKALIRNTTGFNFREAFIVLGNNFIEVGNLLPGEEREVKAELNGSSVKKRYDEFMDYRYGQYSSLPRSKRPPDWRERNRKRNIIDSVFDRIRNNFVRTNKQMKIMFLALNSDDPDYRIMINGEEPKKYHTNVIYSIANIEFEKGMKVEIPTGIIQPVLESGDIAHYDGSFNSGIRVQADGDVDFKFVIPDNISVESFKVSWSAFIPIYIKQQMQQTQQKKNAAQQIFGNNTYEFFVYNLKTSQWEKFDEEFTADRNINDYINDKLELKLRTSATLDKSGNQGALLGTPEIELKGVVK